jgi:hypothetical protein
MNNFNNFGIPSNSGNNLILNSSYNNDNTKDTNNLSNLFMKNYNEVLNDYKKQLEILAEEKDNLSTNLSITRHQQLQTSMKIEALQTRVFNLEGARLEDMKILENLKINK